MQDPFENIDSRKKKWRAKKYLVTMVLVNFGEERGSGGIEDTVIETTNLATKHMYLTPSSTENKLSHQKVSLKSEIP